ncbi:protein SEC13 homolog isoform X2 [Ornithodoros turicata]|uniref:protein SEC13 homolog isoform X2 n=1 Tax=Ornithodoros turicata TaxID=34597 RepID=UPI00313A2088
MVSLVHTVDTAHSDMVHDAQTDYYGTRLATCSSDKSVKVFDLKNGTQKLIAVLTGHEGPVWQVAWAHPMFGTVLASCSYDRKIMVWMDIGGTWDKIYEYGDHDSSVNSISWAPHEFGLMLACGSSDGAVSVLSMSGGGQWNAKKINNAHAIGCNAVSWAPAITQPFIPESDGSPGTPGIAMNPGTVKQFVTGGCDNLVKIWKYMELENEWVEEQKLEAHSDWVRDVAWAPSVGTSRSTIASCSQDCRVILWTCDSGSWSYNVLGTFADVIWLVSWNLTGNILAVSGGDNNVTLWKEGTEGQWMCISDTEKDEVDIPENVGV